MAAAGLLAFASCEDQLDSTSQSTYNDQVVFSNAQLAEKAVFGIYSYFSQTNSHRGRYMPYYGMNTDAECYYDMSKPESDTKSSLACYSAYTADNWMCAGNNGDANAYSNFFNAIENANYCIDGIQKYGDWKNDGDLRYLLGEAMTLRAQYYYDLIRAWGDVPFRFEPVNSSTLYLPKADRDSIYKRLISDLKTAADYLPWPNTTERTKTVERVNKAYCLGLRARLILMAYGYSQRPNSLDDPDGSTVRRSSDPYLTSDGILKEALADLENIINNSGCKLNSSYESIWDDLATDVISSGGEPIFEIPFAAGRGRFFYHFGVYHATKSAHCTKNNMGGQNIPAPTLYYEYDNGDLRRDVNCVPYKWNNGGYTMEQINKGQGRPGFNFGKYDYERMNRVVSSNDDGVNLIVIRYADILLMASEIANELGDLATAKKYFLPVRERAFSEADRQTEVTDYINAITSKDQMLKAIQKERLLEFPGEMLRKQDLIRWNILGSTVKEEVQKIGALHNRSGQYADVPTDVWTRTVDGKLEVYGLSRGETGTPSGDGWTKLDYDFIQAATPDEYVNGYYVNDPDQKQFWPIFLSDINSSNGVLINNYGY